MANAPSPAAAGASATNGASAQADPADDYGTPGRAEWLDFDWSRHQRWVRAGGRNVNVVDVGEGPVLVLVHGLAGSWQNWLENIPALSRSHRVVALDLPGHGYSEAPEDGVTISDYARCVDEVFDQLGIESAVLVGNSMGGFVSADLAIQRPERVSKLVLVAAAVLWRERRRARGLVTLAQVTESFSAFMLSEWKLAVRHPNLRAFVLSSVVQHPRRLSTELCYELIQRNGSPETFTQALRALYEYDLREDLERIACPTLVVWGRNDQLVSVDNAQEFEQILPDARTVIFEDTGHIPMLERPARFNRVLEEFLAE